MAQALQIIKKTTATLEIAMTVPNTTEAVSSTNRYSSTIENTPSTLNGESKTPFQANMEDILEKYRVSEELFLLPGDLLVTQQQITPDNQGGKFLPYSAYTTMSDKILETPLTMSKYELIPLTDNLKSNTAEIASLTMAGKSSNTLPTAPIQSLVNNEKTETLNGKQPAMLFDHNKQFQMQHQQMPESSESLNRNSHNVSAFEAVAHFGAGNQTVNSATGFTAVVGTQLSMNPGANYGMSMNSLSIQTPVSHPQWNQSVGQSIQWMVNQNLQHAEIKLNPPELGMLDIQVKVSHEQANITFSAANSQVRDSIEAAIPRLRELLEQTGLTLGDVNVSGQSLAQQNKQQQESNGTVVIKSEDLSELENSVINQSDTYSKQGLIDTYV